MLFLHVFSNLTMNFSFYIARRYLFSKKSVNAINLIAGVAVTGIAVGTAALVLVLSVFNGFEDLMQGMFGKFNPDVKIIAAKGKTFVPDSVKVAQLRRVAGVVQLSKTLEEVAFFEYRNTQDFGTLKGVDDEYEQVTKIDSAVQEGKYQLQKGDVEFLVMGVGMRNKLAADVGDAFEPMTVYMPVRDERTAEMGKPFKSRNAYPSGTFVVQQEIDNQYIIASLSFVRELLGVENTVSALEIRLTSNSNQAATALEMQKIMGDAFIVKDRYHQDEAFLKLMNIEKWMSFAIVGLTLLLVAFNIIGCLWMMMLDKQKDIATLKALGTDDRTIGRIFLQKGLLLAGMGIIIGFILALVLYFLQKKYGLISVPDGFAMSSYPISIRFGDFVLVTLVVLAIGFGASILPARRAARVPALMRV
jgi:lipoprotein-releasing system permease protein